jgi:hypothetical protein
MNIFSSKKNDLKDDNIIVADMSRKPPKIKPAGIVSVDTESDKPKTENPQL